MELVILRVYMSYQSSPPAEVQPLPSPHRYWTRRGIAEWLTERFCENRSTLVGIDHGFAFPLQYFETHQLAHDWPAFLDDFQMHCLPTKTTHLSISFAREREVAAWPAVVIPDGVG